jgi:predicted aspartyl protease
MGHVFQRVRLSAERAKSITMLVDTGASRCLIAPQLARALGARALKKKVTITLANRKRVRLPAAAVHLQTLGRNSAAIALIGECPAPILGSEALETLGLMVDPSSRRLRAKRPYAASAVGFLSGARLVRKQPR